ncbi:MAG: DUF6151 family protein [Polyangiaceae bacterium]
MSVALACTCGAVRGRMHDTSAGAHNRVLCYCDDCRDFTTFLARPELVDDHGGSDILQTFPANLVFTEGVGNVRGIRLSAKGLHRWYADCCKTPVGNTLGAGGPFAGVGMAFVAGMDRPGERDRTFGPPRGTLLTKFATRPLPDGGTTNPLAFGVRTAWLLAAWTFGGKRWPSPFFDRATGRPIAPLRVLDGAERDALRARP